jgi:hypothetical protein
MDSEDAIILALALPAVFLAGLLALWALTSRRHWFWRALPLVGWLMLTGPAAAPELWLMFAAEFLTIGFLVVAHRWLSQRAVRRLAARANEAVAPTGDQTTGWQFSLVDVLLVALCMPAASALRGQGAGHPGPSMRVCADWLLAGAICGGAVSLAAWTVFGAGSRARPLYNAIASHSALLAFLLRGWRYVPAIAVANGLGALLGLASKTSGLAAWANPFGTASRSALADHLSGLVVALWLIQTVWLRLWRIGGRRPESETPPTEAGNSIAQGRLRPWQIALRALLAVPVLLMALFVAVIWSELAKVVPNPPDAPGAEQEVRLVAIADQLDWSAVPNQDPDTATPSGWVQFAAVNAARLADAHKILAGPCAARVNYSGFDTVAITSLRGLERAFDVQSRAAVAAGDYGTAANAAMDGFRLGSRGQRGGLIVNKLVGIALEGVGIRLLVDSLPRLDRAQGRSMEAALAAEERDRESLDDVYSRELAWTMNANGWSGRLEHFVEQSFAAADPQRYRSILERSDARTLAQLRLLRASLAIGFYRQDEGHFPPSLAALVPNWLDAAPLDPFSDQTLIYRADDERYVLYSIGPNRIDDGGHMVSLQDIDLEGDLFLDVFDIESKFEAQARVEATQAAAQAREQAEADAEP